jgi:predicted transport protein
MPVFHISNGKLKQLNVIPQSKERHLQKLIEENLLEILDLHFLATEYTTTSGGRIDTLAIATDGAPVIIEYKRNRNDNVITQALFYLRWLKTQKAEFFEMLVSKKGLDEKIRVNWKNPQVICIAESYSKYDIDALEEISANLELYRYKYYENNIFALENVKGEEERPRYIEQIILDKQISKSRTSVNSIELETFLNGKQSNLKDIFLIIRDRIFEMDDTINEKINNKYVGFRVSKMFAEVHIQKSKVLLYLRPIVYDDPKEKLYKVPDSYNWVLDRRVYIDNESDIDYVMGLVEQSYKDVL